MTITTTTTTLEASILPPESPLTPPLESPLTSPPESSPTITTNEDSSTTVPEVSSTPPPESSPTPQLESSSTTTSEVPSATTTEDPLATTSEDSSTTTSEDSSTTTSETSTSAPTTEPGGNLDPNTNGTISSPSETNSHTSGSSNKLPGGVVAGIVIGVIGVVALAIVGIYLLRRRKRRYTLQKEEESNPGAIAMESGRNNRGAAEPNPNQAPVVRFDDPLDDAGVKKLFDQLDDRISDHVVNSGLQESPKSSGFTKETEASTENILFRGQALLARQDSRLYMLRALFAYHIFGSIADQMIFTKEQRNWVRQAARGDRATRRAVICRQLENKEHLASAIEFLYGHLDRETRIHIPESILKTENYQASLGAIARNTANVIIRLGLQPDSFKLGFLFNSNYGQVEGVIPCETSAIGEFRASSEEYEIFGEAGHGGVASAMISPSVYRRPSGENHKYRVRNMRIFMAPRTLS